MSDKSQNAETSNNTSKPFIAGFERQIIEASPSGMVVVDASADDMPIVYVNAAFETLTGYASDETIGRNCRFLQGDDRDQSDLDILRDAIENEQACTVTLRNYRKDGTLFWNELRVSPISDADGQVTHFVGIQHDVTEREEALDQVRTKSANLRAMLDSAKQSFVLIDRDARVVEFDKNSQMNVLDIFGKHLYPGVDIYKFVLEHEREIFSQDYQRVLRGETITSERTHHGQNRMYYFDVTLYPVTDEAGEVLGVCMSAEDITQRRQTEQALKESEELYRLLTEHSTDMIALHNQDGTWIYASPAFERVLGYTVEEILAMPPGTGLHPDDIERAKRHHQRVLAEKQALVIEYRLRKKDGDYIWVHSFAQPILDEHGEVKQLLAVSRDITPRKQMEEALRDSEYKYRSLAENAADGLIIWDARANKTLYTSPGYKRQMGVKPNEALTLSESEIFALWHPDDIEAALASITEAVENKRDDVVFTLRIKHRDGHYIWQENHLMLRYAPDGTYERGYSIARDITERKQMEDALRRSEANVRSMLNSSMSSFTLIDREGRIIDADKKGKLAAQRIFGKKMQPGDDIYDYVLSRDHKSFRHNFQRALTGEVIVLEKEFPTSDGKPLYFEVGYYPVIDSNDTIIGVCMSSQDITERKRMEEALRRSEQEFRTLVENIPDTVQRLTREGVHLYVNPLFAQQMNMTQADIIGKSNEELGLPSDLIKRLDDFRETACTSKQAVELDFNFAVAGETHHFSTRLVPELDEQENVVSLLGITRDITERKASEQHLAESEARFRQVAENIEAVFWLIDLETRSFLYISPAYDSIWQRSHLEVMDDPGSFFDAFHPEDRDRLIEEIRRVSENPQQATFEHRIVRPSGEIRSMHVTSFPVLNGSGDVYRMAGISQDITERKKAEQREFELELERERHRLLSSFIEGAAHEFRTPLATINSSAYLMSRSDDPDRRKQKAKQVEGQIKRITRLVDSLLLLTRLESNSTLASRPIDPGGILQSVCAAAAEPCARDHQLTCDIASDLPSIMGDADYLSDAFQQIIDNACRFTPEGGKIDVQAGSADDHIRVEIRDSGPGIAEDDLPHIFETFWRQDVTHSTPGFGLGLSIVQRIIEQHGGKITVESIEGQGTTVRLILPTSPKD